MTRKLATAAVAALAVGAFVAVTMSPAEAKFGRKRALWGGIAAGLAGAAILGHAGRSHAQPVYEEPGYQECWRERRPVYDRWGEFRGYRSIRVCN